MDEIIPKQFVPHTVSPDITAAILDFGPDSKSSPDGIMYSLQAIYTLYKETLVNAKYYGRKLNRAQQYNLFFEIVLALGATGSGIAGWSLWESSIPGSREMGAAIYAVIASLAAAFAILKPLLQMSQRVERYSKLFTSYQNLYVRSRILALRIASREALLDEHRRSFDSIFRAALELSLLDDPNPSKSLFERACREATTIIREDDLWWPKHPQQTTSPASPPSSK